MNYKLFRLYIFYLISVFTIHTALAGGIKGKAELEGVKNCGGILVYIEYAAGKFTPSKEPSVMDQKKLAFTPKVLPILAGTKVNFLNDDNVLHNVFTPTKCAGRFNLGTWPRGKIRSHTFNKAGCIVTILCDVHPEMQAWIAVLQNPYFVQTDKKGQYVIKNIPPGHYVLKVWSPFYKSVTMDINVKDKIITERDIILKKTDE